MKNKRNKYKLGNICGLNVTNLLFWIQDDSLSFLNSTVIIYFLVWQKIQEPLTQDNITHKSPDDKHVFLSGRQNVWIRHLKKER